MRMAETGASMCASAQRSSSPWSLTQSALDQSARRCGRLSCLQVGCFSSYIPCTEQPAPAILSRKKLSSLACHQSVIIGGAYTVVSGMTRLKNMTAPAQAKVQQMRVVPNCRPRQTRPSTQGSPHRTSRAVDLGSSLQALAQQPHQAALACPGSTPAVAWDPQALDRAPSAAHSMTMTSPTMR